ncbi:putative UDP-rhamnose:rhamnosyltransferase 1 [Punica granatum]|uniref:UDP-rhamnose:rhamnosyltransferase 1 n=1 Tax=Punica granatum TaxID=22663 RepID=A0A6P8DXR9_PUNGR|nr:putative UDP-rhamnose:rhamnosyltransferase 1 [Punica granatum]
MARDLHVMMLPWSAFGHIIPFFQLSISLARNGVQVSFVSTPRNIQRLPQIPADVLSLIHFVDLPLPQLDGNILAKGDEATVDIPFEKIQYLKIAYDRLKYPFEQLVISKCPDWIINDFIPYWVIEIAQKNEIPVAFFSVFSTALTVFVGPPDSLFTDGVKRLRPSSESLTVRPPWVDFPSSVAFRSHEAASFYAGAYMENASGISDVCRLAEVLQSCDLVAIRSCPEYEGQYLELYEELLHKKVIPVGLLPPDRPEGGTSRAESFQWLDGQEPKSVVFVGFGSECKLTKEQVHEIAHGLELSGLPFLWALRRPIWAVHEDEVLPDGFVERTCSRGIVCMGWIPQMEILAHPSIGGSLFHAGWGSVIETLQFGHCLVVLPLIIDQPLQARLLVEKGIAIEVERKEDGSFTGKDIAIALRFAMVSEEGNKLRSNLKDATKIFGDHELHRGYATKFVEYLRDNVKNKSLD